jgi:hypothetical protein
MAQIKRQKMLKTAMERPDSADSCRSNAAHLEREASQIDR